MKNNNRQINLYTQGQRFVARALFIAWLLACCSPQNTLAFFGSLKTAVGFLAISAGFQGVDSLRAGSEIASALLPPDAQCLCSEHQPRKALEEQMAATAHGTDSQGCLEFFTNEHSNDLMSGRIKDGNLTFNLDAQGFLPTPQEQEALLQVAVNCAVNAKALKLTQTEVSEVTLYVGQGITNVTPLVQLNPEKVTLHSGWSTHMVGLSEVLAAEKIREVYITGLLCCFIESILGDLESIPEVSCQVDPGRCELIPVIA